MNISTQIRYSILILKELAARSTSLPVPVRKISDLINISPDYATQLIQYLKAKGLVKTKEGRYGGCILGRSPEKIKLSDVFLTFNENYFSVDCCDNPTLCKNINNCFLKYIFSKASQNFKEVFDSYTLKDLIEKEKVMGLD